MMIGQQTPKAPMTYENLGYMPKSQDLSLKAGIWATRLGFGPQGRDLGLKVGIWALRLGSESEGGDVEEEGEGEGGKIPPYV